MPRLRWFLIGIAVTCFTADYIRLRAQRLGMESDILKAELLTTKAQVTSTACLIELAYNKSLMESWGAKVRLSTTAQVVALNTVDRAKEGDAEALASLKDLGYAISGANKRLVVLRGVGGP